MTENYEHGKDLIVAGQKLYLDGFLKKKLDLMLEYQKKDFDVVFVIFGIEGEGKSVFALTCGWYLSGGKITAFNIAEGTQDAIQKLKKLPDKSTLIIDEGSLLFSSRDSMTREQKNLVRIMNVIRQKNMILVVVAPSFFDLSKYVALHRSRCAIKVYAKGTERGRFAYYNTEQKKLLYIIGKQKQNNDNCVRPLFRGRFLNFKPPFYQEYLKTKARTLLHALEQGSAQLSEREMEIKICKKLYKNFPELTQAKLGVGFGVSKRTICSWINKNDSGIEQQLDNEGEGVQNDI